MRLFTTFAAMKTKSLSILIGAAAIFSISCNSGSGPNVIGNWQGVGMSSPSQDSMIKENIANQLKQIDTLTTVDSFLAGRFKSNDIAVIKDSMKAETERQQEIFEKQRKELVSSFKFKTMTDGRLLFPSQMDPSKMDTLVWYLADNNKKIVFDPSESSMPNQFLVFHIVEASSKKLKLRVQQFKSDIVLELESVSDQEFNAKSTSGESGENTPQ